MSAKALQKELQLSSRAGRDGANLGNLDSEISRIAYCGFASELKQLTQSDVDKLRAIRNPPEALRRTLEAACLILAARSSSERREAPTWQAVQDCLGDEFLWRLRHFDIKLLAAAPILRKFLLEQYFGDTVRSGSEVVTSRARKAPIETRVCRINTTAATLYIWCVEVLTKAKELDGPTERPGAAPVDNSFLSDKTTERQEPKVIEKSAVSPKSPLGEFVERSRSEKRMTQPRESGCSCFTGSEELPGVVAHETACLATAEAGATQHESEAACKERVYFETLVSFETGSERVDLTQEATLEVVAITACMRHTLKLELIGCGTELDGFERVANRLKSVCTYFRSNKVACTSAVVRDSASVHPSWVHDSREPRWVLCRLHLQGDASLFDYFYGRIGWPRQNDKDLVDWLEYNFEVVKD